MVQVKGSPLAEMFSNKGTSCLPHDKKGRVFLDVDAASFSVLQRCLRNKKLAADGLDTRVYTDGKAPELKQAFHILCASWGMHKFSGLELSHGTHEE